jgi:hypothetical protein
MVIYTGILYVLYSKHSGGITMKVCHHKTQFVSVNNVNKLLFDHGYIYRNSVCLYSKHSRGITMNLHHPKTQAVYVSK